MGASPSRYLSDPARYAAPAGKESAHAGYDYVIVGGGAAGCVLASRLSEDPEVRVLLLEAGPAHGGLGSRIPIAWSTLLSSAIDWAYDTTPQPRAGGRTYTINRGRVLGGSTVINALIYQHPAPADISWPGWSYDALRPYFARAEEVWAREYPAPPRIHDALVSACAALGIKRAVDFNEDGPVGAGAFAASVDARGERHSTADAYLSPAVLARPNLIIAVQARTERVLFESDRAVGVRLSATTGGPSFEVRARREVVLCAGAIGTPHLLLLSGLGPAADLEHVGVPLVRDLPAVGAHFRDHMSTGPIIFKTTPGWSLDYLARPWWGALAAAQWLWGGTGAMRNLGAPGAAFVNVNDPALDMPPPPTPIADNTAARGPSTPDVELAWFPLHVVDFTHASPWGFEGVSIAAVLLKPTSKGRITLASASPRDPPVVDPNYFSSPNDMRVLTRAVRLILRLARVAPAGALKFPPAGVFASRMQLPNGKWDVEGQKVGAGAWWPGRADPDALTDEEIAEYVEHRGAAAFHPTSTARIGLDERDSVVGPALTVHGVRALRIVDASVLPEPPSGHPVALVVALAERAADIMKGVVNVEI